MKGPSLKLVEPGVQKKIPLEPIKSGKLDIAAESSIPEPSKKLSLKPLLKRRKDLGSSQQHSIPSNPKFDKVVTLSDLTIEGLEQEKDAYLTATILAQTKFNEGYAISNQSNQEAVLQLTAQYNLAINNATRLYTSSIESALNQPIDVVLQNANVTNLNDIAIVYRDAGAKAMERMKEGATGKTLTEKPKSSKHGIALAGYIPIEQSFGKAGDIGQAERFNEIVEERFQEGKNYVDRLNEIVADLNNGVISEIPAEVKEILGHNPVAKTTVTDKEGRIIYGLVDENGLSIRGADSKPVFAYKNKRGDYFNEVNDQLIDIQNGKFKEIQALSYISGIEKDADGEFKLVTQKVTGDHDQLAIGTKGRRGNKIDDHEIVSSKGFIDDHGLATTVALIDETKQTGAVRHGQDAGGSGTRGSLSVNDLSRVIRLSAQNPDITSFLEAPKIKAMKHEKLSGNPHPEDFAEGNYAFYYPDGKISIAHNEAEIVEKYNEVEAQGYNIGINPRYGWRRNQEGKLEIDPYKISAQSEIMANSRNQKLIVSGPEFIHLPEGQRDEKAASAEHDAESLYELASFVSLIKLQEPSSHKDLALAATEKILRNAEATYVREYKMVPPTVEAIVDKRIKLEVMKELKEINLERLRMQSIENSSPRPEVEEKSNFASKMRARLEGPPIMVNSSSVPNIRSSQKPESHIR